MLLINNILVVLDPQEEDQPALTRAAYLAKATGAKLHLFMCAYDAAVGIATFLTGGQRKTFVQTLVDGNEVMIQRLADALVKDGIDVSVEVVWERHLVEAVIAQCETQSFDLVMKHAKNQRRAEVMFNHHDWNLMRYCPYPLMLVKEGQWDEVGQVLAAIDPSPQSPAHQSLNEAVLQKASELAGALEFELHLVTAYPAPPVFAPVSVAVKQQVSYRTKMKALVHQNLDVLAAKYGLGQDHIHAMEGPVDWVVPQVSKELVAEFVVMGHVSRESKAGLSIGTAAESTLEALNTNVLVVRLPEAD